MNIVVADIKIQLELKGKRETISIKDFITTDPISKYGLGRLKRKAGNNDFQILSFDVKKIIGETSY